jgi:cyclopropane fatty-acyl-phospholipid synthase-like methyltransferase
MSTGELTAVEDIGGYYDEMAGLIEILGGNIHVGYWNGDDDRTPLLEAINRLTDLLGAKLALRPGERLLDIGCGAAVPAIRLGQRVEADITGITVSTWQVEEATRRVNAAGLRGQVHIEYGDAAALAYPDGSFDAVLAIESLPHARDRAVWLREMNRVLRPGGRVVLTDFTEQTPLSEQETTILRAGALEPPPRETQALAVIRDCGFVVDEAVECGDRIRRSYDAYFDRIERNRAQFLAAFGEERVRQWEGAMHMLLAIYREKIGYLIVVAHKDRAA